MSLIDSEIKKSPRMDNMRSEAEKLANQAYRVLFNRDETTTGKPVFLLINPELPGCMAHGRDIEEAKQNLRDARIEYILSLLEDGLPVPKPAEITVTGMASTRDNAPTTSTYEYRGPEIDLSVTDYSETKESRPIADISILAHNH